MINATYRFSLDVNSTQSQVSIPVTLGDTARAWCISLTNGGTPYTIADGCLAMMYIKRPTGTYAAVFCPIENSTTIRYDFALNKNTAAVEGIHDCQVKLINEKGMSVASPRFSMIVSDSVVNTDDINISDKDKTTIEEIVKREAARSVAEVARVNAESARVDAEAKRVDADKARHAAMTQAVDNVEKALGNVPGYSGGLPTVSTGDNGKFMRVVDGKWAAAALRRAEEVKV